jgi:hypothetical protein
MERSCARCSCTNASLLCGKCKSQRYCSKACQASDWHVHKRCCVAPVPSVAALFGTRATDIAQAPVIARAPVIAQAPVVAQGTMLKGLSLPGFYKLLEDHGGRDAFAYMSTNDVKYRYVIPGTAAERMSFCETLERSSASGQHPHVARANRFVSHVYSARFLKVVDALSLYESRQRDLGHIGPFFYYFDLLVVNQHSQADVIPFEVLRDEFGNGVRNIGHTLMLTEWKEAEALRRSWCVFELYTTLAVGAVLEIIMAPEDEGEFLVALRTNFEALSTMTLVDAETARAHEPRDADNIRRVIAGSAGGFLAVNQLVNKNIRSWMVNRAHALYEELRADDREHSTAFDLATRLGALFVQQSNFVKAEPLLRWALEGRRRVLHSDDPLVLCSIVNLADLYRAQSRLEEAEPLLSDALSFSRRINDRSHQ